MDTMRHLLNQSVETSGGDVESQAIQEEQDLMSQAQELAVRDMAANGPARPVHSRPTKTITRGQLLAQRAQESLETSLKAAENKPDRLTLLEGKLDRLTDAVLKLATVATQTEDQPPPVVDQVQFTDMPVETNWNDGCSASESPVQLPSPTQEPRRPGPLSVGGAQQVRAVPVTQADEGVSVVVPAVQPVGQEQTEAVLEVIPSSELLAEQVTAFFGRKDVLKNWRTMLTLVGKPFAMSRWPEDLQARFLEFVRGALNDRRFSEKICAHIRTFEQGQVVSDQAAAMLVLACAGFSALTVLEPSEGE